MQARSTNEQKHEFHIYKPTARRLMVKLGSLPHKKYLKH